MAISDSAEPCDEQTPSGFEILALANELLALRKEPRDLCNRMTRMRGPDLDLLQEAFDHLDREGAGNKLDVLIRVYVHHAPSLAAPCVALLARRMDAVDVANYLTIMSRCSTATLSWNAQGALKRTAYCGLQHGQPAVFREVLARNEGIRPAILEQVLFEISENDDCDLLVRRALAAGATARELIDAASRLGSRLIAEPARIFESFAKVLPETESDSLLASARRAHTARSMATNGLDPSLAEFVRRFADRAAVRRAIAPVLVMSAP